LFNKESIAVGKYFLRAYPRRTVLMVSLLLMAGLAEGVGLVTLIPLLEVAVTDGTTQSGLGQTVGSVLGTIGLDPTLGVLLAIIVLGMTLKAGFIWLAGNQIGFTVARIATDLRLSLIRSLLRARWKYFSGRPAGHVANALSNEAHRAAGAYRELCMLLAGGIQILVYLAVAFLISWQIAILAAVGAALIVFVLRRFVALGRIAGGGQTAALKSLVARMTDALQGMKPIKAMGREQNVLPLLEKETMDLNRAVQDDVRAKETRRAFYEPLLVLLIAIGLFLALTFGNQPFSSLMVMTFLFYRVATYGNSMQSHYQTLASCESALWSLREQVEAAEAEAEKSLGNKRLPRLEKGIRLRDVTFGYGDHAVLENVSLHIPAGSFTAVVGASGAGKTTVADLIVGLHRPQSGVVLIDAIPIEELDLRAWRQSIGYVPQEMLLFHDSVFGNVTLGAADISRADVLDALAKAGALEFVERMPRGLDTVIGERGTKLSGGQRQRIAIARALVRKPALLVLDEVTTALDPGTEAAICSTLKALGGDVTIVAISHQPALKAVADRVYRLQDGAVFLEREGVDLVSSRAGAAL
jgi:ATP-binding cassette, subfamily C, bacterial